MNTFPVFLAAVSLSLEALGKSTDTLKYKFYFQIGGKLYFEELYEKSIVLLIYTTDIINDEISNWLQHGV